MTEFAAELVDVICEVTRGKAQLHIPEISGNEWINVKECLDTSWISATGGKYISQFEELLVAHTGASFAITTVTGTAALHACLILAGVSGGDEVICPAFTFVATANAVKMTGAIPHFADIDRTSLGIDATKLSEHLSKIAIRRDGKTINRESGRPISAIVCMHTFGHICDVEALASICDEWKIELVEDAAESLGSTFNGKHAGTFSRLSALSFNGNKIITTGGGGAILAADEEAADRARHLTTTARLPHRWEYDHDLVGFNYRMPNINAAIGAAQIERLEQYLGEKRHLQSMYKAAFADIDGVDLFEEPKGCRSNYWLATLVLSPGRTGERDRILERTNDAGLGCRPAWRPMHLLAPFLDSPRMELPVTEEMYGRIINIPSSPILGRKTEVA
jgi:perosamine synthetase